MSHFSWTIDGSIVGLYLIGTMIAGLSVRKYVGKVEHFLVAGREMDVYLGVASLAATEFGIVTCMYTAELGYNHGFAGAVPGIIEALAMFLVGWTGFCIRPLRDSGVITIAELFEKRFGPRIRWASGVVIVLGGLLNMGVFLRQGGEFLVTVTGMDQSAVTVQLEEDPVPLDEDSELSGESVIDEASAEIRDETSILASIWPKYQLEITMSILLVAVATYTIVGGMLSVLITDYLQFVVMSAGLLAVTLLTLYQVPWNTLVDTVQEKHGAGGFNPLVNNDLGWSWVIFNGLLNTAAVLTWQTTIARVLSAKDTRTGLKVYTRTSFFFACRFVIPGVLGIAALATLAPDALRDGNSALAMPTFLSTHVPVGLMGLVVAAMLAADMSTDSSYMLTWGSVIYNDLLAPFRKTQWSERRGLRWNRSIVALIGVFLLIFGLWYPLKGEIWTFLTVTGTIYLSSMSVLLISCCYWRRANNWGAGAAILAGAFFPIAYLVMELIPATHEFAVWVGPNYSGIAGFVGSAVAMVVGSLLKPRQRDEEQGEAAS
jgi:SSS family solute:Na+ symporter